MSSESGKKLKTAVPLDSGPPKRKPPVAKPSSREAAAPPAAGMAGAAPPSPAASVADRRGPRPIRWSLVAVNGILGVVFVALCLTVAYVFTSDTSVVIPSIGFREVVELSPLQFTVAVELQGVTAEQLEFSLLDAPEGATMDERTGVFSWCPTERQGPGEYRMTVRVAVADSDKVTAQHFTVYVSEANQPPVITPVADATVVPGGTLAFAVMAIDPDVPTRRLQYRLLQEGRLGAQIDTATGEFRWIPEGIATGRSYRFEVRVAEAVPGGLVSTEGFEVRVEGFQRPVVDAPPAVPPAAPPEAPPEVPPGPAEEVPVTRPAPEVVAPAPVRPPPAEVPAAEVPARLAEAIERGDAAVLKMHEENKLNVRSEYPNLRKLYAERFEVRYDREIRQAYGDKYDETTKWLNDHVGIKEEFYLAIDPEHDNVPAALALFRELRERFPQQIEEYPELAIAVAVTWDDERRGVYDYEDHQRRAKATMPGERLRAVDNFRYVVEAEQVMQGRGRFLPWEFLKHVVNHKTPLRERQWAVANYLGKRAMIGKCYHEVPYDEGMLESKGEKTRLDGKEYHLPNLRSLGGVCAMQADFASRVAKSIGVPAEYVRGESRFGERHAWVMWVELKGVKKNSIAFTLESYGRYRGDRFYVGRLADPQTGREITDRQLELRLHTVGMDPLAKRHADLIMEAYPMLCEKTPMEAAERLLLLNRVIQLCPGNEAAWVAMSKMFRNGVVTKQHTRTMMKMLEKLFTTFAAFPDFTWQIFDDLVAFQDVAKQRETLYGRLVLLYETAGRPDLACEARLKYTDYLVADKQYETAIEGLALTIKKFPAEGRYVPRMLDKLEGICKLPDAPDTRANLVRFYREYLPMIPPKRGDRPSVFCIEMFERAIARFKELSEPQLAEMAAAQLARIKAGQEKKP